MQTIVAIVGPTAVGKSALALRLARALGGEIVNGDALQLYRGLDIGTAKPDPAIRAELPHHLFDLLDPTERADAALYARLGRERIGEIAARGRPAFVVGGSGFYLQALLDGLGELPPIASEVRSHLLSRLANEGLAALVAELRTVDPEAAARISPGDRQRVLRALELFAATGEPLSSWHRRAPLGCSPLPALRFGLTLPRALLYDRIESRVGEMIAAGWREEVARLLERGVPVSAPAFQALGYRSLVAHLEGRLTLGEAVAETVAATRRYAKRQGTWFRRDPRVRWFDARRSDEAAEAVIAQLGARDRGGGR